MAENTAVRHYMQQNIDDFTDAGTGEVNLTQMAEDACRHFNDYEGNDVPGRYFDCSYEVADEQKEVR